MSRLCLLLLGALLGALVTVVGGLTTQRPERTLHYTDCGVDAERPILVQSVSAHPLPVRTPGKLRLAASVNVTRALPPALSLHLTVTKYFLGIPFKVPCYKNLGSCHYEDVCSTLAAFWAGSRCPRRLRRAAIPCRCPFTPGVYSISRHSVRIPRIPGGVLETLAKGEYEVRARVVDDVTGDELGCLQLNFHMRRRRRRPRDAARLTPAL